MRTVELTAANASGVAMAHALVRGNGTFCYGDSGYTGAGKRDEAASGPHLSSIERRAARRPSAVKSLGAPGGDGREIERRRASARSKVEHPFRVIRLGFGWAETRYRRIKKNLHKARVMAWLSNLAMLASAGRSLDPPPRAVSA